MEAEATRTHNLALALASRDCEIAGKDQLANDGGRFEGRGTKKKTQKEQKKRARQTPKDDKSLTESDRLADQRDEAKEQSTSDEQERSRV
jgi:hypothetical protein